MRDFFKQQLNSLRAMTGSRQVEFMSEEEATLILDRLCVYSRQFSRIPIERQMAEVEKQLIEDPEFTTLNPRIFFKWMLRIAGQYSVMTEEDLTPKVTEPILEGEKRDYWLNEWKKSIDQMQSNFTQAGKGGGSRLKESLGIEKAQSVGVIKNYDIWEQCPNCERGMAPMFDWETKQKEGEVKCPNCNGTGQINIVSIPATSEEEARKQYTELFGSEITKKL